MKYRTIARATLDRNGEVTITQHSVADPDPVDPNDGDAVIDQMIAERPELGRTELTDEDCAKLRFLGVDMTEEERARSVRGLAASSALWERK